MEADGLIRQVKYTETVRRGEEVHENVTKYEYYWYEQVPTMFCSSDPKANAEEMNAAINEKDYRHITEILAIRTFAQRLRIAIEYKRMYKKDLVKQLKRKISGERRLLITALMTPVAQLYAKHIHDALPHLGKDEEVFIDVFFTMSNVEIQAVRDAYKTEYTVNLIDALSSAGSGPFRRLIISLCDAKRNHQGIATSRGEAMLDAKKLVESKTQWNTAESTFNTILRQRNYAQLQLIFEEYEKRAGLDIMDAIKGEFAGYSVKAYVAAVECIRYRPKYFAKGVEDGVKDMTSNNTLVRIAATRGEVDMANIQNSYSPSGALWFKNYGLVSLL